jgi:DNA-binding PadR family transcriptional regulator
VPVKHGLLALLAEGAAHGYQLKADFERRTGGSWELNIGQVYTTLQRLERDGLVTSVETEDDADRRPVAITAAGRAALTRWYGTPVLAVPPPRDELAIKVLLAIAAPDVDVDAVVQRQRTAVLEHLQALTRRKRDADPVHDLAAVLHLDALILRAEAEVRWLDTCEARLRHRPANAGAGATAPSVSDGSDPTDARDAGEILHDRHEVPARATGGPR